ncbi:MBOAT family protein [Methylophilus sp. Leaf414]|uniref:MBOAT family O-acyltransferase n=1 Tax=Methylophilus sp. Leaf414 TaxID=1736371 RepID=UPI000700885E|nr:MBOAT family protein [Methylophilus sp. Leaf414]KQT36270.1 alginate O-acetyltransferase [Methylophilus sp. Leaf414]
MLFNSYIFIFAFFPIAFIGFFYLGKYGQSVANLWLAGMSLFFYGWWDERYLALLLGSILFNFSAGYSIHFFNAIRKKSYAKLLLIVAIILNLLLLGYYKYAGFFALSINQISGSILPKLDIILPLGISFFTFTQIAFLVDTYQRKIKEFNFINYTLFVTYFPHLIAGPVLHHNEMMPQFSKPDANKINSDNISAGLSIFVVGLAKKILVADSLANIATPIFTSVASGSEPMLVESWLGVIAYSLQLYFDFSAYSEMAIGISLMLNIRLPINFNSPYKARSIIDFWRRWHMTLSRFLRDYLYIPLGGNRKGQTKKYLFMLITMVIGGLWHGAGWTFIIWGGLHGIYLIVNHLWRGYKESKNLKYVGKTSYFLEVSLTFTAVAVAWVFFRADTLSSAFTLLQGMAGVHGLIDNWIPVIKQLSLVIPCLVSVFLLPNVLEIFKELHPTCDELKESTTIKPSNTSSKILEWIRWRHTKVQAIFYGCAFFILIHSMQHNTESEFLYFQF